MASEDKLTLEEACRRLKENDPSLTLLDLSGVPIGDAGAVAVAFALRKNDRCGTLHLGNCNVGPSGAAKLGKLLEVNTALVKVFVQDNHIGDKGAEAIAASLKRNATLLTLNAARNRIGDVGAAAIAETLCRNTSLQKLYLYENEIANHGASAIAELVVHNRTLQEMFLWENKITDSGMNELRKAYDAAQSQDYDRQIQLRTHWKQVSVGIPVQGGSKGAQQSSSSSSNQASVVVPKRARVSDQKLTEIIAQRAIAIDAPQQPKEKQSTEHDADGSDGKSIGDPEGEKVADDGNKKSAFQAAMARAQSLQGPPTSSTKSPAEQQVGTAQQQPPSKDGSGGAFREAMLRAKSLEGVPASTGTKNSGSGSSQIKQKNTAFAELMAKASSLEKTAQNRSGTGAADSSQRKQKNKAFQELMAKAHSLEKPPSMPVQSSVSSKNNTSRFGERKAAGRNEPSKTVDNVGGASRGAAPNANALDSDPKKGSLFQDVTSKAEVLVSTGGASTDSSDDEPSLPPPQKNSAFQQAMARAQSLETSKTAMKKTVVSSLPSKGVATDSSRFQDTRGKTAEVLAVPSTKGKTPMNDDDTLSLTRGSFHEARAKALALEGQKSTVPGKLAVTKQSPVSVPSSASSQVPTSESKKLAEKKPWERAKVFDAQEQTDDAPVVNKSVPPQTAKPAVPPDASAATESESHGDAEEETRVVSFAEEETRVVSFAELRRLAQQTAGEGKSSGGTAVIRKSKREPSSSLPADGLAAASSHSVDTNDTFKSSDDDDDGDGATIREKESGKKKKKSDKKKEKKKKKRSKEKRKKDKKKKSSGKGAAKDDDSSASSSSSSSDSA